MIVEAKEEVKVLVSWCPAGGDTVLFMAVSHSVSLCSPVFRSAAAQQHRRRTAGLFHRDLCFGKTTNNLDEIMC